MEQLGFFPEYERDIRPPQSVMWNLWHGCTKASEGCRNCYVYRRDLSVGRDPTIVTKTSSFTLPISRIRSGEFKGEYKIPPGSTFNTCFSSDFFHKDADGWRPQAWDMIRERSDCRFFMITKRPERIADNLPHDWGKGWEHVSIAVTCENMAMANKRLPVYLAVPMKHYSVMIEPMLTAVDLSRYFEDYCNTEGKPLIELVSAGGESGAEARVCNYDWVLAVQKQCVEYGASFYYHQTGAKLIKDGKLYNIPRKLQHQQAHKAGIDHNALR